MKNKKIITQLTGGLGNQLFQYAIARTISMRQNIPMKIDISFFEHYEWHEYSLSPFNIKKEYASKEECDDIKNGNHTILNRLLIKSKNNTVEENNFYFDSKYLDVKGSKYLIGYWQSEKYFKEIEEIIRKEFEILIEPSDINKKVLDKISVENSVSIHIRRGNYVTNETVNTFHGTCSLEYYYSAIDYFKEKLENPVFYIFSNDMEWCKQNLIFEGNKVFLDHNDDKTDYEDLRLMKNCKYNIIANSTFSWWAAWLNNYKDKVIIAPKKWFSDEKGQSQIQDLLPLSWIVM